jgi:hypothetical protein
VSVNKTEGLTTSPQQQPNFLERWKPWLLWWNTEEWMACWIGFILFGGVTGAVVHGIPSPVFEPWHDNPFVTFANKGNYGLIVLFFVMGGLLWLSMALYQPAHWQVFPVGYVVVFFVALISNMLASNGNVSNYRQNDVEEALISYALLPYYRCPSQCKSRCLDLGHHSRLSFAQHLVLLPKG